MYKGKRVAAIISEFNPFHEGHELIIKKAREMTGAEYILIVMSGDFVQRGEPAIYSKYERAMEAVRHGADIVLQIPETFASSASEDFAGSAVSLIGLTGIVDDLVFGSESGDIEALHNAADALLERKPEIDMWLCDFLKDGASYPEAREKAASKLGIELYTSANDILSTEYLMAVKKQNLPITCHALKRDLTMQSAHSIRDEIKAGNVQKKLRPVFQDDFSDILSYRLLMLQRDGVPLTDFMDVSTEIMNRINKDINVSMTFSERVMAAKTRNYTYSRISRAMIHILLGVRKDMYQMAKAQNYQRYIRVLALNTRVRDMLGELGKTKAVNADRIQVITSASKYSGIPGSADEALFKTDIVAADIYNQIFGSEYNEFTRKLDVMML